MKHLKENANEPNYLSLADKRGKVKKNVCFGSSSDEHYQHKMVIGIPIKLDFIKFIALGSGCGLAEREADELAFIYGAANASIKKSSSTCR